MRVTFAPAKKLYWKINGWMNLLTLDIVNLGLGNEPSDVDVLTNTGIPDCIVNRYTVDTGFIAPVSSFVIPVIL